MSYKHIFAHLALLAAAIVVGTLLYWSRSGYRAVPALIRQLDGKDDELRLHAVQWLADIGPSAREAVPALVKALHDRNWAVATAAAYALNRIDIDAARQAVPAQAMANLISPPKETVSALTEAFNDSYWQVRFASIESLGQMGHGAENSVERIHEQS